jgi:hypothetical protein
MPRVKIRLATGVVVPSRRRAGLIIHAGQPQEFDVTDEQYLTLLDDNKLQVTEITDDENTEATEREQKLAAAAEEGLEVEVSDEATDEEVDAAIEAARDLKKAAESQEQTEGTTPAANTQSAQAAGEGVQNNKAEVTPGEGEQASDGTVKQPGEGEESTETPAIPDTESKIKKQSRDVVVAQAQSLGIELDYADEAKTTKAVIAAAIVAKQKEA